MSTNSYNRTRFVGTNKTLECGQYASCRNRRKSCYCDELCSLYNDCCPDVISSSDHYTESAAKKINSSLCQSLFLHKKESLFWIVSQCPMGKEDCRPNTTTTVEVQDIIPVTGDDNFVYVNAKCAECHGVRHHTHWYLSVTEEYKCDLSVGNLLAQNFSVRSLTEMIQKDICGLRLYYPHGKTLPRRCIRNTVDVEGCPLDHAPIIAKIKGPSYQNEECCIKDTISPCRINDYQCHLIVEDDPLAPDDLAIKFSRFSFHQTTLLLQFGRVRS